ncbi:MAG: NAD-dependent succinate-semialdehyde dehydrogenase [Alphaproteobacteria bacterium]|nr:NAD-dependent succinate-semialdehyde dehydrogenase [Alphaproteobacteria bacterium]
MDGSRAPVYEKLEMFIGGKWCQGSEGKTEDVVNPATEQPLGKLPHASKADLDRALAAAQKGFETWRKTSAYDRAKVIRKAVDLFRQRADAIAQTLTLEQGKVLGEAKIEVTVSADIIEWYAEEGRRAYGRIIPGRMAGVRQMAVREPVGPVAAFTPWNFPAVTPARKIAGAIAAGCSIIIKASEETPGTCIAMVRCFEEAGLPAGVLNLVFGVPNDVSTHLIASPVIRKISFTGSIPVGKHLARMAADGMKKATMELGGHSPVIVFDDVDPVKTAEIAAAGKYRNAGQVCISPTRFFVQEKVFDKFADKFIDIAKNLKVGNGLEAGTQMGPLANIRRVNAMEGIVADAQGNGARIQTGGKRIGNQGYFFQPTVVTNVDEKSKLMRDEPFGPVAPIVPFKTFDEVVKRANALEYGLAAYAFTHSTATATAVADALESGMVGVNHLGISMPETPFGGVKESGYGHEGGIEGLDAYLITKFVTQIGV